MSCSKVFLLVAQLLKMFTIPALTLGAISYITKGAAQLDRRRPHPPGVTGCQHGSAAWPPAKNPDMIYSGNTLDYRPIMGALLAAMNDWSRRAGTNSLP